MRRPIAAGDLESGDRPARVEQAKSLRIGEHRHLRQKPERASSGVKFQETFMAIPSFVIVEAL